jgi:uncharacterized protein YdhG (YjbR/CyaY superfamily)
VSKTKIVSIVPGGVDEYIVGFPEEVQSKLLDIRETIQGVAPDAIETVSYFDIPGYSYKGYDYNGMFAWFSYQKPNVRLHVRPPVIENNKNDLRDYSTTKAIVSFPVAMELPKALVVKLVKASIDEMISKK